MVTFDGCRWSRDSLSSLSSFLVLSVQGLSSAASSLHSATSRRPPPSPLPLSSSPEFLALPCAPSGSQLTEPPNLSVGKTHFSLPYDEGRKTAMTSSSASGCVPAGSNLDLGRLPSSVKAAPWNEGVVPGGGGSRRTESSNTFVEKTEDDEEEEPEPAFEGEGGKRLSMPLCSERRKWRQTHVLRLKRKGKELVSVLLSAEFNGYSLTVSCSSPFWLINMTGAPIRYLPVHAPPNTAEASYGQPVFLPPSPTFSPASFLDTVKGRVFREIEQFFLESFLGKPHAHRGLHFGETRSALTALDNRRADYRAGQAPNNTNGSYPGGVSFIRSLDGSKTSSGVSTTAACILPRFYPFDHSGFLLKAEPHGGYTREYPVQAKGRFALPWSSHQGSDVSHMKETGHTTGPPRPCSRARSTPLGRADDPKDEFSGPSQGEEPREAIKIEEEASSGQLGGECAVLGPGTDLALMPGVEVVQGCQRLGPEYGSPICITVKPKQVSEARNQAQEAPASGSSVPLGFSC